LNPVRDTMDFRRLEVFNQVFQKKSFSKAGQALYLSQPTVSEHIRLLENDLGLPLFDRKSKEVLPTPAGQLLYQYTAQLMALREESFRALKQFRDKGTGDLLIGGSNIPGQYLLPPLLGRFKERFPGIQIRLFIGDTLHIRDKLLEGVIEFGIVGAPVDHRQISCDFWTTDQMICIAPSVKNYKSLKAIAPEEILKLPFILREKGSGTRTAIEDALKKIKFDPKNINLVAEMGSNEAIRQAVKAGVGISIVSRRAVEEDLELGRIREVKIKKLPLTRDFFIITLKQRTLSPLALEFKDFIVTTQVIR
jgi:DNA-binding transcriptional LysR family regulator